MSDAVLQAGLSLDRQGWLPQIKISGAMEDQLQQFRDGLVKRSLSVMYPMAAKFLEGVESDMAPEDIRTAFVTSTLVVERAMMSARGSGLVAAATFAASKKMIEELRGEAHSALTALEKGVEVAGSKGVDLVLDDAKQRISWLWNLGWQTLKIKRGELARELEGKAPQPSPPGLN